MNTAAFPLERVAIVGAGTVGASWAALMLAHDVDVAVFEPDEGARMAVPAFVEGALRQLRMLGRNGVGRLRFTETLEDAVTNAAWVQESVREDVAVKRAILAAIDRAAPADTLIGSSTSSLLLSEIAGGCTLPQRVIIAHPFNPPHLIPLVELFGDAQATARASALLKALGKHPLVMRRELPGHVANRLSAALYREAVSLVESGAASVAEVDEAVRFGPGLRWATQGPHMLYHLGGGRGGIRHYLQQLGPAQERRWASLTTPVLTPDLCETIVAGVEAAAAGRSLADLEADRDARLLALLSLEAAS